jgi:hypothetical protein
MRRPMPIEPIPPETTRVARAAFPQGHRSLRVADALETRCTDGAFLARFPTHGHPACPPWRLALVTLLQCAKGLPTAVTRRLLVRRMNHDPIPPRRPTRAHSRRHPGDPTRRATLRRLVGILHFSGAMTVVFWTLFSQDIMAGACNFNTGAGCVPPISRCTTMDGRPGLRVGGGPCEPLPAPLCGAVLPKYLIFTVLYVPPGTKGSGEISYVIYEQNSTTGTKLSVSASFKEENKISYMTTAKIGKVVGCEGGFSYSA